MQTQSSASARGRGRGGGAWYRRRRREDSRTTVTPGTELVNNMGVFNPPNTPIDQEYDRAQYGNNDAREQQMQQLSDPNTLTENMKKLQQVQTILENDKSLTPEQRKAWQLQEQQLSWSIE